MMHFHKCYPFIIGRPKMVTQIFVAKQDLTFSAKINDDIMFHWDLQEIGQISAENAPMCAQWAISIQIVS